MSLTSVSTSTTSQVRLRLSTREPDISLPDSVPILVPTSFRRYQLSTLINGLLENEKSVPFEFLVNGKYLRTSLDDYLTENGISAENTLAIEYVRARIPPQYVASYEHEDWVSDVDVLSSRGAALAQGENRKSTLPIRILTSSYDGRIRIWNTTSQVLATSASPSGGGHTSFVKSARFISQSQIVSAGFDHTLRLWKYNDDGHDAVQIIPQLELNGHTSSVDAVAVHTPSKRLLSASADHSIGYWSTLKSELPKLDGIAVKRRRPNHSSDIPQRGPLSRMQQHTGPVTGVAFDRKDPSVAYSASHDHTVRTWDLVTSALVDTRNTNNALYCIEHLPQLGLLACGSAGRDIKLVDPRASASTLTAMTLKGHKNHVVALSVDPNSEYGLASGSHDGTCRVWDVRGTQNSKDGLIGQSMFTLQRESLQGSTAPLTGEGIKVFAVSWDSRIGILSAGEDKAVQINGSPSKV